MAESETEISKEELQKEIAGILNNASLDKTSTKKVIQALEKKLGIDLTEKKKLIDQLVMDYVNSMDSDEDSVEEEPPQKVAPKKKPKKEAHDDEDDEEHDDSNDSDWGYHHHESHLLDGYSDESYRHLPQESTISTSEMRHLPNRPRKALILKRVSQSTPEEDEADIFGKLTAKKLRKLSEEQRDFMMIQINQMFYDKSFMRASPPKRRFEDKATSTAPAIQYEAKKIYRVNAIPNISSAGIPITPIALANIGRPVVTSTNGPRPVVAPLNVPEPVVQVSTPKPQSGKKKGEEKKKKAAPKPKKKESEKTKKGGGAGGVKKRRKGSGYTKACKLSPALAELMGESELPRHEVVKRVWAIIKEKQLYDPKNRQYAICDKALFKVIGEESFHTFSMMKYLKNHFLD